MTRQRYTAIKVKVKMLTLNVTVMRGEINLQNNVGKVIPLSRKILTGKESSIKAKSEMDKLKMRRSFTDLLFFFFRITRTSELPVTPSRNVTTYRANLICFSESLTAEKLVGWPMTTGSGMELPDGGGKRLVCYLKHKSDQTVCFLCLSTIFVFVDPSQEKKKWKLVNAKKLKKKQATVFS